jgi:hypothetical protein
MAIDKHLRRLAKGVDSWNAWRRDSEESKKTNRLLDLRGADLSGQNLHGINLLNADLRGANLVGARLGAADLFGANLSGANLSRAGLSRALLNAADLTDANLEKALLNAANLNGANLTGANLEGANLYAAVFIGTKVSRAILTAAKLSKTVFENIDLRDVAGLDQCVHDGPSAVDYQSLRASGPLPLSFLRGVGLPDSLIDYLPSLLALAIQHYSSFISYSTKDGGFANRLHSDLQDKGVRCWFAPHDMPIGGKIWDEIDAAIRLRDKVLLILSEHSIKSDWVEDEVTKAFEEEGKRGQIVLFPIRLDDAVMDTNEPWAAKLRARHIGDFRRWKDHDEYQRSFARVLRDLTVKKP